MKAVKITNQNFRKDRKKNLNTLYVDAEFYNDLVDDVAKVDAGELQIFTGVISFAKAATLYIYNTLTTNQAITAAVETPMIGAYAEITLYGDGSHAPTFPGSWIKTPSSGDYDTTLGVMNKIGCYWDGYYHFYTITPII